jgi:hypothetical protein
MRDHLRPVSLFGKDYYWHREPGQPLQLLPVGSLPPAGCLPDGLYATVSHLFGGVMPWPEGKSDA